MLVYGNAVSSSPWLSMIATTVANALAEVGEEGSTGLECWAVFIDVKAARKKVDIAFLPPTVRNEHRASYRQLSHLSGIALSPHM